VFGKLNPFAVPHSASPSAVCSSSSSELPCGLIDGSQLSLVRSGASADVLQEMFDRLGFLLLVLSIAVLVLDCVLCHDVTPPDQPSQHRHNPSQVQFALAVRLLVHHRKMWRFAPLSALAIAYDAATYSMHSRYASSFS
jgi:hypothetical protein